MRPIVVSGRHNLCHQIHRGGVVGGCGCCALPEGQVALGLSLVPVGGGTLCATEARLATTNTTQRNGGCRDVGMAVWVAPSLGRGRPRLLQAAAGRPGRAIMRLFSRNSSSVDAHVDDGVVPLRLSPPVP